MKIFFSPKLGLDVAGAGGPGLYLFLLLLPQDPFGEQEVRGCDVVVPVGLQGSEGHGESAHKHISSFLYKQKWLKKKRVQAKEIQ